MKEYLVKVTEMLVDHVWVTASSKAEAKAKAIEEAECEFEFTYDAEIVEEQEI